MAGSAFLLLRYELIGAGFVVRDPLSDRGFVFGADFFSVDFNFLCAIVRAVPDAEAAHKKIIPVDGDAVDGVPTAFFPVALHRAAHQAAYLQPAAWQDQAVGLNLADYVVIVLHFSFPVSCSPLSGSFFGVLKRKNPGSVISERGFLG